MRNPTRELKQVVESEAQNIFAEWRTAFDAHKKASDKLAECTKRLDALKHIYEAYEWEPLTFFDKPEDVHYQIMSVEEHDRKAA